MATPDENARRAENLLRQARGDERCIREARAVRDALDALRDAAEFTLFEKLTIAGVSAGGVIAAFGTGGLGGIVAVGATGLLLAGIAADKLNRVNKANRKLETANDDLEECLNR